MIDNTVIVYEDIEEVEMTEERKAKLKKWFSANLLPATMYSYKDWCKEHLCKVIPE